MTSTLWAFALTDVAHTIGLLLLGGVLFLTRRKDNA